MVDGLYVEAAVTGADACPTSTLDRSVRVESVTTSRRSTPEGDRVVGELTVADDSVDEAAAGSPPLDDPVFVDGDRTVYRFEAPGGDCPCARVPEHGCPVRDLRADGDRLVVSFLARDVATVREVVADLRSCCAGVRLRRLCRSTATDDRRLVVVDREGFTDRQYEVLRTAHEMGYFDRPRAASAETVATELSVTVPTFSQHLAVAQSKLLDQVLDA
jgi:hypothetical protein